MERRSRTDAEGARPILLAVAFALCIPVLLMAFTQYVDSHENVAAQCFHAPPAGAAISETALVHSAETAIPAGRLCVYEASAGGTISVQTGWPTTIAGLAATLAIAALTVVAVRSRRGRSLIVALLPALVTLGLWAIVFLSAHTMH